MSGIIKKVFVVAMSFFRRLTFSCDALKCVSM